MKHSITPEREMYHKLLAEFAASLPDGALVYDIGRTHAHEYKEWFPRQVYKSIDRNPKAEPDILMDVGEDSILVGKVEEADALLCNGVTESADNPFTLIEGLKLLVKADAVFLFGIRLTAYPLSEHHDYFRFTKSGALLELGGHFVIRRQETVLRDGVPSYLFAICGLD